MSDDMTIIVNAKVRDVTPVSVNVRDMSRVNATMDIDQHIRTGVAESFDAISPTIEMEEDAEKVTIAATDKYGKKVAEIPKGVDDYERLKNMPRLADKVIRGNRPLEYYGIETLTNLELQTLLA